MAQMTPTLNINASEVVNGHLTFARTSSATKTGNTGLVETVAANVIRYDHYSEMGMIGTHKGYLLEESSTNLCLQSEDFGTTWVTTAPTYANLAAVTANDTNADDPAGGNNADLVAAGSTGDSINAVRQTGFTFTDSQKYTVSVWAKKKGNTNWLEISNKDDAGVGMTYAKTFNLDTGAVGVASGGTVNGAKMEEYPGGWYRCSVTFTGSSSQGEVYFKSRTDDAVSSESAVAQGDGMWLWGAQVEALPYHTSYVPTTTATVLRAADVASVSDTDNMWNWHGGVSMYVDYVAKNTTESITPIYHYSDTTNANYVTVLSNGKCKVATNNVQQLADDGGGMFDAGFTSVTEIPYRNVVAMKYNDLHLANNGTLSANLPDNTVDVPMKSDASNYSIQFFHGTGYSSGSGWLKGFRIYSQRLSNADLQNLSIEVNTDSSAVEINSFGIVADDSITEAKLTTDSVSTNKIFDAAVTNDKLANNSVSRDKILNNAIDGTKIADNSITTTELAPNSVTSAHLALDVILAEDIANNAVTFAELADDAVRTIHILDDNVTRAKLEADIIDNTKVADDAIQTENIVNLHVTRAKLEADVIDNTKVADNAIQTENIVADNIVNSLVADNAIQTENIVDGHVTIPKIGASGTPSATSFLRGDGQWADFETQELDPLATGKAIPIAIALG